jgi:hypothetical protein
MIHPGVVGPKTRPQGVVDGEQVNIPAPCRRRYERWGDAGGYTSATYWTSCVPARRASEQGNPLVPGLRRRRRRRGDSSAEEVEPVPPRKAPSQEAARPYRKPTQVGWQNTAKVNGRTFAKELGKLTL